jgi:hypothetical protein
LLQSQNQTKLETNIREQPLSKASQIKEFHPTIYKKPTFLFSPSIFTRYITSPSALDVIIPSKQGKEKAGD